MQPSRNSDRPFEGIKIVDLTHVLAGPFSTYQLALLGAEVSKIEVPGVGDIVRQDGFDQALNDKKMGTFYLAQNANKRSVTLDLKQPEGRDILRKMLVDADILVENYRPGALDSLGLGYDNVSRWNEKIIYCSMSGYGATGSMGERTSYDQVIQAMSGLMAVTGTPEVSPLKVGAPVLDYASGLFAAFAMSAALFQREKTGRGQRIDSSMLDSALMLMSPSIVGHFHNGVLAEPKGNRLAQAASSAYPTKDGMIMLGGYNERQNHRLWMALGRPDLAALGTLKQQVEHRALIEEALTPILLEKTADEWESFFNDHGVPAARVRNASEALSMSQMHSRALMHHFGDHHGMNLTVPLSAFSFGHGGPRADTPPETLGQSTDSVLSELGYSPEEIRRLRSAHII